MKVFISYSRHDEGAVRSMVGDLQRARVHVWLDEDLGGGDAWWTEIINQIRACTVFIFALSKDSLYSKPCRAELGYAQALDLPILPVQIGEVSTYRADPIFSRQLIDYRNPTAATGFALMGALNEYGAQRAGLPDPLPEPPPIPYEYLQRLGASIHDPAGMAPAVQMQALFELRAALDAEDDGGVLDDIRELLRAFRSRTDVTFPIATEIDTILGKRTAVSPAPASVEPEDSPTVSPTATPVAANADRAAPHANAPTATTSDAHRQVEPATKPVTSHRPAKMVPGRSKASSEQTDNNPQTDAELTSTASGSGSAPATESRGLVPNNTEAAPGSVGPQAPNALETPIDTRPARVERPFLQRLGGRAKIVLGGVALAVVVVVAVVAIVIGNRSSPHAGVAARSSTPTYTTAAQDPLTGASGDYVIHYMNGAGEHWILAPCGSGCAQINIYGLQTDGHLVDGQWAFHFEGRTNLWWCDEYGPGTLDVTIDGATLSGKAVTTDTTGQCGLTGSKLPRWFTMAKQ